MSFQNPNLLNKKLNLVFDGLKCAAKSSVVFSFVLKNVEDSSCRYYYAHGKNTLMERSKLVATKADSKRIEMLLNKVDVIESCSRERAKTKWKNRKLTNVTFLLHHPRKFLWIIKNAVFPEPLIKNHSVTCLIFEKSTKKPNNDNLCLFRALTLHLHGKEKLEEETSKWLAACLPNMEPVDAAKVHLVCITTNPTVEDLTKTNIFLYNFSFVDGASVGELARRGIEMYCNTERLLHSNGLILLCFVSKTITLFKTYRRPSCDQFINKAVNLEKQSTICKKRVNHNLPKNVDQQRETFFDKLDACDISYMDDQKNFKNMADFDFQSICFENEESKIQKLQHGGRTYRKLLLYHLIV